MAVGAQGAPAAGRGQRLLAARHRRSADAAATSSPRDRGRSRGRRWPGAARLSERWSLGATREPHRWSACVTRPSTSPPFSAGREACGEPFADLRGIRANLARAASAPPELDHGYTWLVNAPHPARRLARRCALSAVAPDFFVGSRLLPTLLRTSMAKRLFLGIDVSTTGAKALLIDEKGAVAASATTALTVQTPKPLWSEQDPHEWWTGTAASIRKALADAGATGADVAAVGLTGQMHGLVLLDGAHQVLRPAILWNDQRTGAQCDEIRERMGGRARSRDGDRATTPSPASPRRRSCGCASTSPRSTRRRASSCCPKDYVRLRLTGRRGHGQGRRLGHAALRPGGAAAGRRRCSRSSTSRPSGCPRRSRGRRSPGR